MAKQCSYEIGFKPSRWQASLAPDDLIVCGKPATHSYQSERFGRRPLCAKHFEMVAEVDALAEDADREMGIENHDGDVGNH